MAEYEINVPGNLLSRIMTEPNGLATLLEAVLNQVIDARASEQLGPSATSGQMSAWPIVTATAPVGSIPVSGH
jgi:hypothetical protein